MEIKIFKPSYQPFVTEFFKECFKALEMEYDPLNRHITTTIVEKTYMQCGRCWCLVDNDKIYGTAAVKCLDKEKRICELKMMYVMPDLHGMGFGKALLKTAIRYAKCSGYEKIVLDSRLENARAIALYKKIGFKEIGRYNQNIYAEIFMEYDIKNIT